MKITERIADRAVAIVVCVAIGFVATAAWSYVGNLLTALGLGIG